MEEIQNPNGAGEPEAAGTMVRLLREIIRTPAFVEVIKANLGTFEEESARELVCTLMNEDPELSVSVATTLAQMVNYLAAGLAEFGSWISCRKGLEISTWTSLPGGWISKGSKR
jgi:hypothetical protein